MIDSTVLDFNLDYLTNLIVDDLKEKIKDQDLLTIEAKNTEIPYILKASKILIKEGLVEYAKDLKQELKRENGEVETVAKVTLKKKNQNESEMKCDPEYLHKLLSEDLKKKFQNKQTLKIKAKGQEVSLIMGAVKILFNEGFCTYDEELKTVKEEGEGQGRTYSIISLKRKEEKQLQIKFDRNYLNELIAKDLKEKINEHEKIQIKTKQEDVPFIFGAAKTLNKEGVALIDELRHERKPGRGKGKTETIVSLKTKDNVNKEKDKK